MIDLYFFQAEFLNLRSKIYDSVNKVGCQKSNKTYQAIHTEFKFAVKPYTKREKYEIYTFFQNIKI